MILVLNRFINTPGEDHGDADEHWPASRLDCALASLGVAIKHAVGIPGKHQIKFHFV